MATTAEMIVVQIDDVDMQLRRALGTTAQEGILNIYFREYPGGMLLIPKQGEFWLIVRRGWDWFLEKKLDTPDEHAAMLAGMGQGDMRLKAAGTILTEAGSMYMNGRALGTTVRDTFSLDDPLTEVTLSHAAVSSDAISPQLNGVLIPDSQWTYDAEARQVKFLVAMGEVGFLTVDYQTWMPNNDDVGTITARAHIKAVEVFEDN